MHFVDARLAQLQLSKQEAARRGFPDPSTLHKVRDRDDQSTPTVRTLLRIDQAVGWEPGSSAVVMLGGHPLTVTARTSRRARAKRQAAKPMSAEEVVARLLGQLRDEITRTQHDLAGLGDRLQRLLLVHDRLAAEFTVDDALLEQFSLDGVPADNSH
jgi:hypothetical protein